MNLFLKKLSENNSRLKFKILFIITSFFIFSSQLFAPPEEPISQDLPSPEQPDPVLAALQSQAEGRDASVFGSSESSQVISQGSPTGGASGSGGASGGSNQASQQNQQITVQIGAAGSAGGRARTTTPTAISNRDLTNISNLESRSRVTLSMLLDKYNNGTITPAEQAMLDQLIEQNDPYGGLSASDYGFCVNMGGPNAPGSFPGYAFMLLVGGVGISGFWAYAGITAHGDGFNKNLSSKMNANKAIINNVFMLLSEDQDFMNFIDRNRDAENLYHVLACVNATSNQRDKKARNAEDFGRISGIAEQADELLARLSSVQDPRIRTLLETTEGLLGQVETPGFDSFLILTAGYRGTQERAKRAVSPLAGQQILSKMEAQNSTDSRAGSRQSLLGQGLIGGGNQNRVQRRTNATGDLNAEALRRVNTPQQILDAEDDLVRKKQAAIDAENEIRKLERESRLEFSPDQRAALIMQKTNELFFKREAEYNASQARKKYELEMRMLGQPVSSTPQAPLPSAPPIRQPAVNPAYNPTLDVYGHPIYDQAQRSPQIDSGVGLDQLQHSVDALAEMAQNPRGPQYYSSPEALRPPYAQPAAASRPVMVSRDAQTDPEMRSIGVQADLDRSSQQLQAQRAIAQSREIATQMTMVPEPAASAQIDRLPVQQGTEPAPAPRIQQPQIGRQVSPIREIPAFRAPQQQQPPQPLQRRNSSPALLQPLRINR